MLDDKTLNKIVEDISKWKEHNTLNTLVIVGSSTYGEAYNNMLNKKVY